MAVHISSFQRCHYQVLESVEVFEFSQDDGGASIDPEELSISRTTRVRKKAMSLIYKVHIKCQEITSKCS